MDLAPRDGSTVDDAWVWRLAFEFLFGALGVFVCVASLAFMSIGVWLSASGRASWRLSAAVLANRSTVFLAGVLMILAAFGRRWDVPWTVAVPALAIWVAIGWLLARDPSDS
jgi:hypothetical protein